MTQAPSPSPSVPRLAVVTDYGPINQGASNARYVLAENGSEYLIKGPSLVQNHPTVGGNEWVAAELAERLGLPVLDHQVVEMAGEVFFASSWMAKPSFNPALDASIFAKCQNRDRAYDVVVFDAWLINGDRHAGNLVARPIKQSKDERLLVLNDHSHLLVSPIGPTAASQLPGCLNRPPGAFVRLGFVRDSITDPARLRAALDNVELLSDGEIRTIVDSTPAELLGAGDRQSYADFLVQRQPLLRDLFRRDAAAFPQLGGPI